MQSRYLSPFNLVKSALLYFHTIRYLKPIQIFGRLWFTYYNPVINQPICTLRKIHKDKWVLPIQKEKFFYSHDFIYILSEKVGIKSKRDWNNKSLDKLRQYNLHYFDFINSKNSCPKLNLHLMQRWVLENPFNESCGWEPYPTSLRIVNWIKFFLRKRSVPNIFVHSLLLQTSWLYRRIEFHIQGNHLIANAKALIFSGIFFEGEQPNLWLKKGISIIEKEMIKQVMKDGAHFELTPMYHSIVLEDLLDIKNIASTLNIKIQSIDTLLPKMLHWLNLMTHPDGNISFFNDSSFGIASNYKSINKYFNCLYMNKIHSPITRNGLLLFQNSGYAVIQKKNCYAILDVGRIGPDYIPGHSHADTLSFELSLFGKRFIVNPGAMTYEDCNLRSFLRGTKAHNTISLNDKNSSEVWMSFRVAKRLSIISRMIKNLNDNILVKCSHNGFGSFFRKCYHQRQWNFKDGKIEIFDQISGHFNSGSAFFYFHPNVSIVDVNKELLMLNFYGRSVKVTFAGGQISIQKSNWYPFFGVKLNNICVEIKLLDNNLFTTIEW